MNGGPDRIVSEAVADVARSEKNSGVLRMAGGASVPILLVWIWMLWSTDRMKTEITDGMEAIAAASQAASATNERAITELRFAVEALRDDLEEATDDRFRYSEFRAYMREFKAANADKDIVVPEPLR